MRGWIGWLVWWALAGGLQAQEADLIPPLPQEEKEKPSAQEQAVSLPPILVTPSAYTLMERAESSAQIPMEDAAKLPLIDNDVMRAMHLFPGVVATDFSARFQLRGSEKNEILVRLDGMELYEPYHLPDFGGAMSAIDLGLVRNAQLYMGGFPAAHGDRMGGVFQIESVQPDRNGKTLVGLDLVNFQLMQEGAFGKGGYLFSARRGYVDWIIRLIDAIQPLDEKFQPRYADLFGKVVYPLGERSVLTPTILYSRDTNAIDKQGLLDDLDSTYDNLTGWVNWKRELGEASSLTVAPYGGRVSRDKAEGETDYDRREIVYGGLRADLTHPLGRSHVLQAGGDLRWADGEYKYFETTSPFPQLDNSSPPIAIDARLKGTDTRFYLQDDWQVTGRLAAIFGARLLAQSYSPSPLAGEGRGEGESDYGDPVVSPRLALAYRVSEPLTLRAAWGRYLQAIDPLDLPVEGNVSEGRKPQTATHYVVGAEWSRPERGSVRVEGYYKDFRDLVGRVRDVGRQTQFVFFPLPEEGRAYGGEVFVRQHVSERFAWTGGYAYALAEVTRGEETVPRDFDQRHSVFLNGSWAVSERTSLNASWRFHTGTPVTPVTMGPSDAPTQLVPIFGEINSERVPSFHSLDVRLTKRYLWKAWEMTAYFQVLNLYMRENVQEYSYDPAEEYTKVTEPFLPITPTLGLVATF